MLATMVLNFNYQSGKLPPARTRSYTIPPFVIITSAFLFVIKFHDCSSSWSDQNMYYQDTLTSDPDSGHSFITSDEDGSVIVDIPVHYLDMQQTAFVGREGLLVTMPCSDSDYGLHSDTDGRNRRKNVEAKDKIVVWKFGKDWDTAAELGFRLYGVGNIKPDWESRASIDKMTFSLTLSDLKSADSGNYFCKIFDAHADSLFKRSLTVEIPAKIESWSGSDTFLPLMGSDLDLFCEASGIPEPMITWFKMPSDDIIISRRSVLKLRNISKEDRGAYKCKADNFIGIGDERDMTVDVLYPPEFLETVSVERSFDGSSSAFTCLVRGRPLPQLTWSKEELVTDDYDSSMLTNSPSSKKQPYPSSLSSHSSSITSSKTSSSSPYLTNFSTQSPDQQEPKSGSKTQRQPNTLVVRTERRDSETIVSVLNIHSVTNKSFGLYRCRARSAVGYSEQDFTLTGLADAPKIISPGKSVRSTEYTIVWRSPSIPVNKYLIRVRRAQSNQNESNESVENILNERSNHSNSTGPDNTIAKSPLDGWLEEVIYVGDRKSRTVSYVITDLQPGVSYEIEVAGVNKYGTGESSSVKVLTMPSNNDQKRDMIDNYNSAMKVASGSRGLGIAEVKLNSDISRLSPLASTPLGLLSFTILLHCALISTAN
ncbi:uncharacterized protein LOC142338620 isoform X2 [Convolutriloba macropyga]|uniref:uncharacterized protein LOC142338620 isoform X2 n=1 Tax=Convolutriloba macropyga TaxID=536237 RepID=UPI003F51FC12